MKRQVLISGGAAVGMYALWCFTLMSILPSNGSAQALVMPGVLSAILGGLVFLAIGAVGFLRIKDVKATPKQRQMAVIRLAVVVIPGLVLSVLMPVAISREPGLTLAITKPVNAEDFIAPLSITFSAESAAQSLKDRGQTPVTYRWDLNGDRKVDQETVSPTLTVGFEKEGVYTVAVAIITSGGQTRTASKRFIIRQSVFSVTPNPPVIEKPVVFSIAHLVNQQNPITQVDWDFNADGTIDETTQSPEITWTYYTLGPARVVATVTLLNRTQMQYERTIEVEQEPEQPFAVTLNSEPRMLISAPPFPTLFSIDTDENVAAVQWDFGDGTKADGARAAHTFDRKGNFPVTVKVRTVSGAVAELTTVVRIVDELQLPDLTFEGQPQVSGNRITGEVPLLLELKPRTSLPFIQFSWEAPEATEVGSTDTSLQAIYRREGTYVVTLVAQDLEDHVLRRPITVEVKPPSSSLSIMMNPETGVAPLEVQFDASETFIPGETITGFEWQFGDQSQPQFGGARAKHTYTQAGTYIVNLTVRTTSGEEFRTNKTIVVRAPQLSACILPSRTSGKAPMGVEFRSDCSTGTFSSILWDFGDQSQSDQPSPIHVFDTPGTYRVSLTVTDTSMRTATNSVTITVTP